MHFIFFNKHFWILYILKNVLFEIFKKVCKNWQCLINYCSREYLFKIYIIVSVKTGNITFEKLDWPYFNKSVIFFVEYQDNYTLLKSSFLIRKLISVEDAYLIVIFSNLLPFHYLTLSIPLPFFSSGYPLVVFN